jgi:TMEM175 potassium channel family protein
VNKGRLEAFSDGVFAIAITLLVLTIGQPGNYGDLAHQLAQHWPAFAAYAVSFSIIGIMWLNHHSIFAHFRAVDRPLAYLNLALLMTVVFIPYPTGVFGEALHRGQGMEAAAVFYSITVAVNAYVWGAMWLYASLRRRLLVATFPESERVTASVLFTIGVGAYTLALGIAFVNAYACLAFHGLMAVYYAFDPVSRRAARLGGR